MTKAEIISIGTELLLGDVIDTNTHYLAGKLRQVGIDLMRTVTIGDNAARIAAQVNNSLNSADIVITTGGLGPTVDDPTREAIALAFGVPLEYHEELWQVISSRFTSRGLTPTVNNQRQSYLPQGAIAIQNPVGTAPAFWLLSSEKMVVSLPGVPDEMKTIMDGTVLPLLIEHFNLREFLLTRTLHVCCMGESAIDDVITEFETLTNPTVGLCAHPGVVDIRIAVKSDSIIDAENKIGVIEEQIRARLPGVIYGVNNLSLFDAIKNTLLSINHAVTINLLGFSHLDFQELNAMGIPHLTLRLTHDYAEFELWRHAPLNELSFFIAQSPGETGLSLDLYQKTKDNSQHTQRTYLGPPAQGKTWAINTVLGFIWKTLNQDAMETK